MTAGIKNKESTYPEPAMPSYGHNLIPRRCPHDAFPFIDYDL